MQSDSDNNRVGGRGLRPFLSSPRYCVRHRMENNVSILLYGREY